VHAHVTIVAANQVCPFAEAAKTRRSELKRLAVAIDSHKSDSRLSVEKSFGVPAEADRAVDEDPTGVRIKEPHDLLGQDRPVLGRTRSPVLEVPDHLEIPPRVSPETLHRSSEGTSRALVQRSVRREEHGAPRRMLHGGEHRVQRQS